MGYGIPGRDQADHDLPGVHADTTHDMTNRAGSFVLIIRQNFKLLHPLPNHGSNGVVLFLLDTAVCYVNYIVRI